MQPMSYLGLLIFVYVLISTNATPKIHRNKENYGASNFKSSMKVSVVKQNDRQECGADPVICSATADVAICCRNGQICCPGTVTHCCPNTLQCCGSDCCVPNGGGGGGGGGGGTCFPRTAKVLLESGSTREMKDLKIGDSVQVAPNKFSKVFMFTHQNPTSKNARYVELVTNSSNTLKATRGHIIYACRPHDGTADCTLKPMKIENVAVGDLLAIIGHSEKFILSSVISAYEVSEQGVYNPQTMHGDIIVDGVRCSTYTDAVQYKTAHGLLAPLRALSRAALPFFYAPENCKAKHI